MQRAMGFAALAILTVIPLLIVVAAVNPTPHPGLGGWVVYGMGLTGSAAGAVTRLFSAPARVLGTTSVFSAVVLSVSGVAFAGSVQAGFESIGAFPPGRGTRSGVRQCGASPSSPTSMRRPRSAR